MIKRIISALLIICLTFSTSTTIFAQDTKSTYIQNEQGKSISYIGEYKLVLWDSENIVYAEQYNSQGNLVASATANRSNGEIITSSIPAAILTANVAIVPLKDLIEYVV